jgi:trk system potassium uptake protein TrkA
MRILVMGCGRIGAQVAAALWREGHDVTVLDTEPESFLLLPKEMQEQGRTTILADGTDEQDLARAGIEEAEVFVAATSLDTRNALAAQKAKHIFKVPRVVCRVGDPVRQELYNHLGLIAVSPTKVTAALMLEAIQH